MATEYTTSSAMCSTHHIYLIEMWSEDGSYQEEYCPKCDQESREDNTES